MSDLVILFSIFTLRCLSNQPYTGGRSVTKLKAQLNIFRNRNSHRKCSIKKGVLRSFTKFTLKHLRQSLFFNKVAGLRPSKFLWILRNFLKNNLFTELLWATVSEETHYILTTVILKTKLSSKTSAHVTYQQRFIATYRSYKHKMHI